MTGREPRHGAAALLLGTQQIPGLDGDTIYVGVPGASGALALLVEVRREARRLLECLWAPCARGGASLVPRLTRVPTSSLPG